MGIVVPQDDDAHEVTVAFGLTLGTVCADGAIMYFEVKK